MHTSTSKRSRRSYPGRDLWCPPVREAPVLNDVKCELSCWYLLVATSAVDNIRDGGISPHRFQDIRDGGIQGEEELA